MKARYVPVKTFSRYKMNHVARKARRCGRAGRQSWKRFMAKQVQWYEYYHMA